MGLRSRLNSFMGGTLDDSLHVYLPEGKKGSLGDLARSRSGSAIPGIGGDDWANPAYGSYPATSTSAYRAIMVRSNAIKSAPLRVYNRTPDGKAVPVLDTDPTQQLLTHVNPWWTHADLLLATEFNLSLWGSAFWFLNRPAGSLSTGGRPGFPDSIWSLRPDRMQVIPGVPKKEAPQDFAPEDYIKGYQYNDGHNKVSFLPEEIIWFRYYNPMDEFAGLSPLAAARQSLDMGRNAIRFNSAFFNNSSMPQDLVFFSNTPLDPSEVDAFYARLKKRMNGPDNAWKPFLWDLSSGQKPERLGYNQQEMQYLEGLEFIIEEAARVWGVPPPLLMSQKGTIYNNMKEARIQLYTSTISEEWAFLEAELNELFLPALGITGQEIQFDKTNVRPLKDAEAERDKEDLEKVKSGTLTINEYRDNRGLEPVDWGNHWWALGTLVPVGDQSNLDAFKTPPPEPPAPEPVPEPVPEDTGTDDELLELPAKDWEVWTKALDARQTQWANIQDTLFNRQERSVLQALRAARREYEAYIRDPSGLGGGTPLSGSLFSAEEWSEAYARVGSRLMLQILATAATDHMALYSLGTFDRAAQGVANWVADRVEFWSSHVNAETAKLITAEIQAGIINQESIPAIETRVQKVFSFSRGIRTEMIARTETLAASNQGALFSYQQNTQVIEKEWLTSMDGRERDAHHLANGQIVPVDSPFLVGGESLQAPGIGGSAANVINCRCTTSPIIQKSLPVKTWEAPADGIRVQKELNGHA